MSAPEFAVETTDLTKVYGSHTRAVDRLNLSVRTGEVYGFLGPNGAGKTTTLRMLLGLVHATSGRAVVLGRAPGDPDGLARVGAMVEEPAFYPYLSGRDNLRVMARLAGRSEAEMRSLIRRLGSGDRTVLLSSHMLGEVQQVCNRVGVISRGALVAEGAVDELRGRGSVLVRAAPLAAAQERAERLLGTGRVQVLDGTLRLQSDPADAPRITRELVLAGVEVSEIRPVERTLEDVFLELTGEEGAKP